jgi:hypothetical protein
MGSKPGFLGDNKLKDMILMRVWSETHGLEFPSLMNDIKPKGAACAVMPDLIRLEPVKS